MRQLGFRRGWVVPLPSQEAVVWPWSQLSNRLLSAPVHVHVPVLAMWLLQPRRLGGVRCMSTGTDAGRGKDGDGASSTGANSIDGNSGGSASPASAPGTETPKSAAPEAPADMVKDNDESSNRSAASNSDDHDNSNSNISNGAGSANTEVTASSNANSSSGTAASGDSSDSSTGGGGGLLVSTSSVAKYYGDLVNRQYAHFEEALLQRVSEANKRNIRVALLGTLAAIVLTVLLFGARIRRNLSAQTADIAKETLEDEGLKIQTQELAMAVVNTVLNDKDITEQASLFLREASTAPETQLALLSLALHVLQHPDCMLELQTLVQKVLARMVDDPVTKATFVALLSQVLTDPQLNGLLKQTLVDVCSDPQLSAAVKGLLLSTLAQPEVNEATTHIVTQTSKELLTNREIKEYSQEFLAEVVGDARLQRESGAALYNSIAHALNPGLLRVVGGGLIVLSVGFLEVALSSY